MNIWKIKYLKCGEKLTWKIVNSFWKKLGEDVWIDWKFVSLSKIWRHNWWSQLYTQLEQFRNLSLTKSQALTGWIPVKAEFSFRLTFRNCSSCVYNCDDPSCLQTIFFFQHVILLYFIFCKWLVCCLTRSYRTNISK